MKKIVETARGRKKSGALENEADFFTGAMTMYLALNPESESTGEWVPISWFMAILRGESLIEKEAV